MPFCNVTLAMVFQLWTSQQAHTQLAQVPKTWDVDWDYLSNGCIWLTATSERQGVDTTVGLMWRLLCGAMPLSVSVKQVILQIGSNNLLKQWLQVDSTLCTHGSTCFSWRSQLILFFPLESINHAGRHIHYDAEENKSYSTWTYHACLMVTVKAHMRCHSALTSCICSVCISNQNSLHRPWLNASDMSWRSNSCNQCPQIGACPLHAVERNWLM